VLNFVLRIFFVISFYLPSSFKFNQETTNDIKVFLVKPPVA